MKLIGLKLTTLILSSTLVGTVAYARHAAPPDAGKPGFAQRVLGRFDADKDGRISDAEAAVMKQTRQQNEAAVKAKRQAHMLKAYDVNHDGKLDATEKARRQADQTARLLPKFDINHNGLIDPAERAAIRTQQFVNRLNRRFTMMVLRHDDSRDGKLSRAELPGKGKGEAKRFARIDTSRDGLIERSEFVSAGMRPKAKATKRAAALSRGKVNAAARGKTPF